MEDQRHGWAYLFDAARPGGESAFALVRPTVNTDNMQIFLDRFADTLAKDKHAVTVLDGAGWHTANVAGRTCHGPLSLRRR